MTTYKLLILTVCLTLTSCQLITIDPKQTTMDTIILSSAAFQDQEFIPQKHSCEGEDVSPQLSWSQITPQAKSLSIIVDDPDAPSKTWVHWVIYNIPPQLNQLSEAIPHEKNINGLGLQGLNDFNTIGYKGPCPPSGVHNYQFKIYALDSIIESAEDQPLNKDSLLKKMEGHILQQGLLVGKYIKTNI